MSAAVPENAQKRRGRKGLIAAVTTAAVALLAALVAFALALSGMIAIPGITQASGELVLQGADEAGRDFFADIAAEPVAGNVPAPAAKPTVTARRASSAAAPSASTEAPTTTRAAIPPR